MASSSLSRTPIGALILVGPLCTSTVYLRIYEYDLTLVSLTLYRNDQISGLGDLSIPGEHRVLEPRTGRVWLLVFE